ncbi:metallophosphoesterase [Candidatus Woesearchaeota archaeon]|nr:metallophosphoesterase [Candidatus Woesearchaeota archaeon]
MEDKKKVIENYFEHGVLVSGDFLEKKLDESIIDKIKHEGDLIVINTDYVEVISQQQSLVDWYEIDRYRVDAEKNRDDELYQTQLQHFRQATLDLGTASFNQKQNLMSLETDPHLQPEEDNITFISSVAFDNHSPSALLALPEISSSPQQVEIIISYKNEPHKYEVKDFTLLFLSRYRFLEGLLRNRQELQNTMPISRLLTKKEKENVSIITLIDEIGETKNGNLILTVEDLTGKIKVMISKNKKELYQKGKDLVHDEVIGITGVLGDKIIFAEDIVWPDVPATHQLKKGLEEEYAIFLSDIHVGSKLFLKEEFDKFLRWINSEAGNPAQKEIAKKVRYIIIAGDLVDGVGIYPSQIDELGISDIIHQYQEFTELIKKIPSDKKIIICPGNHDAVHLAEPQSSFDEKFAPGLFKIPNVTLVTNPAMVNIGKTENFPGFDVLLYHGYSFDYYVANVDSIRNNGGYHRADLIIKFLLKRRHLAPSFKSTPYFPGHKEDPLLIKKIPDFLISGHIHYSNVANYKGITTISGSCWQGTTTFQEKLGHQPEPARVPIVNLKTREIKVLKFG